mgnify:CR=1 FL=1
MTETILNRVRDLLEQQKKQEPLEELKSRLPGPPVRSLSRSLRQNRFSLIAEVKKASPSAGLLRRSYRPAVLAKSYEKNGACAISVLTCPYFFHGSLEDLRKVREATTIPILRKDFLVDPYQIVQSRVYGADLVLLIVRLLSEEKLKSLLADALSLGMEALLEVHDNHQLKSVLPLACRSGVILGVNNRDLKTLKTDLGTSFRLIKEINCDKIPVVSESGIKDGAELQQLQKAGFRGALVGTSLLRGANPGKKLRNLLSFCQQETGH